MDVWSFLLGSRHIFGWELDALRARAASDERRTRRERRLTRESAEQRFEGLEQDVAELALFVRTLYRLAVEKGHVTPAEFAETAKAVDGFDGTVDGRSSLDRGL